MSGGVGPTVKDIHLPSDEPSRASGAGGAPLPAHTPRRRFLSFRQLNALAVAIVLASSGMVGPGDIAFALLSLPYLYFLSSAAFPPLPQADLSPIFGDRNLLLTAYVSAGALLGLFLPVAYILEGVLESDKEGIKAAAPHVFLLASQVFMEGVTFTRQFSLPMRAFVPIAYNTKRMFTIADWVWDEIGKVEEEDHGSPLRLMAGRGLAVVNMAFWAFNLFGFLLPVYLPRAFRRYYGYKQKV